MDHELQVFAALVICLGCALISGMLELSTALGAFIGGIVVASARETEWVHHALEPFRVLFIALFFISIGMLIDIRFMIEHWRQVVILVILIVLTNTMINALALRMLRVGWRESLYSAALLSQIGEFSFVLAAIGYNARMISEYAYQLTIAAIAVSLLVSPIWIEIFRRVLGPRAAETA